MNSSDRDSIGLACEQLVYRAARLTDQARWEDLVALFAAGGKLVRPSDPTNPLVGREAILASLRKRPPRTTRHVLSNVLVEILSPTRAHVSSVATLFSGPVHIDKLPVALQKISVGEFEDDVEFVDGSWVFVERNGSMALESEVRA